MSKLDWRRASPSKSIRLRFVDWLKRIRNHAAQHLVQKLGGSKVHTNPAGNLDNAFCVGVNDAGAEAKINNSVYASRLSEQIDVRSGLSGVAYFPLLRTGNKNAAGLNHNLIRHQHLPLAEALKMLAAERGVESADDFLPAKEPAQ